MILKLRQNSKDDVEGKVWVLRVVLVQDGNYDPPVLWAVQALYGGNILLREFKVKDGGVLLDPLRVRALGDDRDAPLDLPAKDYLRSGVEVLNF